MKLAAKTGLYMGDGSFDASTVADDAYTTPPGFGPQLGALSYLVYKTAEARISVDTDAAGQVRVMAGTEELATMDFDGVTSGAVELDLMNVQGQTRLQFIVDVQTAGTGTGTVTGSIDVDQPAIIEGGC